MKTPIRLLTLGFAASMLAGYVVYSQRLLLRAAPEKPEKSADSSAAAVVRAPVQPQVLGQRGAAGTVAPWSMAPTLTPRRPAGTKGTNAVPGKEKKPGMVAPGSKSAAIFRSPT